MRKRNKEREKEKKLSPDKRTIIKGTKLLTSYLTRISSH
jgi:hypothetical protein